MPVLTRAGTPFKIPRLPCLHKLMIIGQSSHLDLYLEPSDYAELRTLSFSHVQLLQWKLSLLPKLVSITLDISLWDQHDGTLLCVALLYHPDYCPALRQIWFSQLVEWDILFLMLERRNQRTKYVSRIDVVDLPFVPFILHKPLALLLEGKSAERPSNLELSFEGACELACDATMWLPLKCLLSL
jgi:hypothetical protein